jgi:hypothetical protein
MQPKIVCNIRMDSNYETNVCGDTIEEIVEKIKEYHTASRFEIDHYTKKGKQKVLYSGWWFKDGLPQL